MVQKELTNEKKQCCGCGLCSKICPKKAISMEIDEFGITYPVIDEKKCINCGLCKKTCAYQKNENELLKKPKNCYIAACKDWKLKKESSSGGIFAAIAKSIIESNGIVYGCSFEIENDFIKPMHIRVDKIENLPKIQGSKYVQSDLNNSFENIKNDLLTGKKVLFSGTPCQVAALYEYLKKINYENLITIDLICHGTPGIGFFQDYIKFIERKHNCKITNFSFRDKKKGWSLKGNFEYMVNGKTKKKFVYANLSSYYNLFLNSKIYRINCYSCKYASNKRIGDLTLGDFWGAKKEHPEIVNKNNYIKESEGISCVLENTEKGAELLKNLKTKIELHQSSFDKIVKYNKQLNEPCELPKEHNKIFGDYKKGGYELVEKNYLKSLGIKKYIYPIWNLLPNNMQESIKKVVGK